MTELDKDFSALKKEIEKKLSEAVKLINEANELAVKSDCSDLAEMISNEDDLYSAACSLMRSLDHAGWESSSLIC